MKFKFKHLAVATLSLSLVLNQAELIAAVPAATDEVTTVGTIKIEGGEINLNYTGKEQNLINISDYYKGTGTVKYRVGNSGNFSTTVPTATDVGKYDVYYYITGDADYNDYHKDINDIVSKFQDAKDALKKVETAVGTLSTSSRAATISSAKDLVNKGGDSTTATAKLTEVITTVGTPPATLDSTVSSKVTELGTALGNASTKLGDLATSLGAFAGTQTEANLGDVQNALDDVQTMFSRAQTKLDAVVAAEEAVVSDSPSHVVVNIVAKEGETPSSDTETPSDGTEVPITDKSSDSDTSSSSGSSSSSSSKSNVPMTINYSVAADGTTSAIIDRKGIIWLREESDGTGAWYGIDNSDGVFELGSRFWVKWLKEGDAEYEDTFAKLDDVYKKKAETNNIEIFLVGVTKPDGTEYKNFIRDNKWYNGGGVGLYVQLGDDWDANDINALFIAEGSDAPVTVQYGTADKFMSLYDGMLFPEVGSKYARLTLTHFSPYAVLGNKKASGSSSGSSSSDLSSYYKALSTKTGEDYSKILCLLSASSISLLYVLVLRKRKFLG